MYGPQGHLNLQSLLKAVGFAEKNFSYQKNGNSENGRVGRLHREKYQKKMHSEKREFECCCSTEPIKAIAIQFCCCITKSLLVLGSWISWLCTGHSI